MTAPHPTRLFSLQGKHAVITGGGSGIGESIARTFAAQGARVTILDRDEEAAKRVAGEIHGQAHLLDITDSDATMQLADGIGPVDILVNNAGIGHVGNLLNTTAADVEKLNSVNLLGAFNCCKAFVPAMLEGGCGSVINIASIGGVTGVRDRLAYTISKHAVVGMTKALALDHSHTGVRFNAVCPGRVETPFVLARIAEYPDPEKARQDMASTQLNGRMARPDEIAAAAVYLASDAATMVTGSCFLIDGGWSCGK